MIKWPFVKRSRYLAEIAQLTNRIACLESETKELSAKLSDSKRKVDVLRASKDLNGFIAVNPHSFSIITYDNDEEMTRKINLTRVGLSLASHKGIQVEEFREWLKEKIEYEVDKFVAENEII